MARALHKSPSEISKYLSGEHNLTLKTIAKLEAADATVTLFDLAGMRNELMELTGRKVDLVVAGSEHEHVRADLEGAFWRGTMEPQRLPASTL